MQDILQTIIDTKREEMERLYAPKPSLRGALMHSSTGIIAEFKRRSPSKGWIKEDGRADVIPLSYQQNGAAALSILTDEHYFGGSTYTLTITETLLAQYFDYIIRFSGDEVDIPSMFANS